MQIDATEVSQHLPWQALIAAIRQSFKNPCHMPLRHHHTIAVPDAVDATLLLMPAWAEGRYLGVKVISVFPGNQQLPTINGLYLLFCANTGQVLAQLDAGELTARRTAAASALAANYLAPQNAEHLLMVGTGRLSPLLVEAHLQVRPHKQIRIWGRRQQQAEQVCQQLAEKGIAAEAVPPEQLADAVGQADLISCATLSEQPLIQGAWLSPGTHVDLVGGFTPQMREVDDATIQRADVFIDTQAALQECGDLLSPLQSGVLSPEAIPADLYSLCANQHPGRESEDAITVFKSVGAACEDLAAAGLVYEERLNCFEAPKPPGH